MSKKASSKKKAMIYWGGWPGHDPELVAHRFERILKNENFDVDVFEGLDILDDYEKLTTYDLIVPEFTQGSLPNCDQKELNLENAVGQGVGLAGCHGGMCDSFRECVQYQFMTGSQWVAHPGMDGIDYMVNILKTDDPLLEGIEDFVVSSEQYYLHVDPAVKVLATTRFPIVWEYNITNPPVDMPVVYTKMWGLGRVFYSSLGHHDDVFDKAPSSEEIMRRGFLWAAQSKEIAEKAGKKFPFSHGPQGTFGAARTYLTSEDYEL